MTAEPTLARAGSRPEFERVGVRSAIVNGAALLAIVGAWYVSEQDAGLRGWSLLVGLIAAAPLYVAARAWRLPLWAHVAAAALPSSVLIIAALHDDGAIGLARAGRYGYGALLFLGAVAWASSPRRRLAAAVAVVLLCMKQYATAWLPWWAEQNPTHLMWGTFYWHNQFGTYCAAGAAVALILAMLARRVWAVLGFLGAGLLSCGVLESGSRASTTLLVAGFAAALAAAFIVHRWRGLLRWAIAVMTAVAGCLFMTSRVFFPHSAAAVLSPGAAVASRSQGDWVESSGVSRLDFWLVGWRIGAAHPLAGGGLQTYGRWSACFARTSYSSNPHDEWLLGWAEGGVIGLLPLLAVLAGVVALVVWTLRGGVGRGTLVADPGRWGALVALVVLVLHMGMDFDWAYPSLIALAGIVGGIAAAPWFAAHEHGPIARRRAITASVIALILFSAATAGQALDPNSSSPLTPAPVTATSCTG